MRDQNPKDKNISDIHISLSTRDTQDTQRTLSLKQLSLNITNEAIKSLESQNNTINITNQQKDSDKIEFVDINR